MNRKLPSKNLCWKDYRWWTRASVGWLLGAMLLTFLVQYTADDLLAWLYFQECKGFSIHQDSDYLSDSDFYDFHFYNIGPQKIELWEKIINDTEIDHHFRLEAVGEISDQREISPHVENLLKKHTNDPDYIVRLYCHKGLALNGNIESLRWLVKEAEIQGPTSKYWLALGFALRPFNIREAGDIFAVKMTEKIYIWTSWLYALLRDNPKTSKEASNLNKYYDDPRFNKYSSNIQEKIRLNYKNDLLMLWYKNRTHFPSLQDAPNPIPISLKYEYSDFNELNFFDYIYGNSKVDDFYIQTSSRNAALVILGIIQFIWLIFWWLIAMYFQRRKCIQDGRYPIANKLYRKALTDEQFAELETISHSIIPIHRQGAIFYSGITVISLIVVLIFHLFDYIYFPILLIPTIGLFIYLSANSILGNYDLILDMKCIRVLMIYTQLMFIFSPFYSLAFIALMIYFMTLGAIAAPIVWIILGTLVFSFSIYKNYNHLKNFRRFWRWKKSVAEDIREYKYRRRLVTFEEDGWQEDDDEEDESAVETADERELNQN